MKASTFENLIRKVVREEIDYSLRREIKSLKEDLRSELKPTIIEHSRPTTSTAPTTSLKEKIMGNSPAQSFTSNGALNDLLNETAQGNTNLESTLTPEPPIPAEVSNVVNRDYRELMRAIDKKKNSRP